MSVNVLGIGIIGFDGHIYEAMNKTGDEMLNILWSGMIIAGILYSVVTGNVSDISNAALDSSKEAVTLCITMLGVMAFWCGLMQIAEDAGLVEKMSGKMQPVIHFLFPQLPKNHPANKYITSIDCYICRNCSQCGACRDVLREMKKKSSQTAS